MRTMGAMGVVRRNGDGKEEEWKKADGLIRQPFDGHYG